MIWFKKLLAGAVMMLAMPCFGADFSHQVWDELLQKHVRVLEDGRATQLDYRGVMAERKKLSSYLNTLSGLSRKEFDSWSKNEQLAFLINSYNAWTVELILSRYPKLDSIKDLGSFFRSPWKRDFITLFGEAVSLAHIEHDLIRGSNRYKEPRIHFVVNCASIGCPALANQAYVAKNLEAQLEEATVNFLSDSSRNYYRNSMLTISPIFKWYREDFERSWRGATSLGQFLALYAQALNIEALDSEDVSKKLAAGKLEIKFSDYDWQLNDLRRGK
jgi:hypothetical protein